MRDLSDPRRSSRLPFLVLLIAGLVAAAGCAAPEPEAEEEPLATEETPPPTMGNDIAAVGGAHQALVRAYESGDVEGFVGMLDDSPELLIFHPRVQHRFDGVEKVRNLMPGMFERLGDASWTDVHALISVEGDVAWLSSEFLLESPRLRDPFIGRATEIWLRRDGGWRLAHGHWSGNPEGAG